MGAQGGDFLTVQCLCFLRAKNQMPALPTFVAMYFQLFPTTRENCWSRCSKQSTPKRTRKRRVKKGRDTHSSLNCNGWNRKGCQEGREQHWGYPLSCWGFLGVHQTRICPNNVIKQLSWKIRRRIRIVWTFPNGKHYLHADLCQTTPCSDKQMISNMLQFPLNSISLKTLLIAHFSDLIQPIIDFPFII